MSNRTGTQEFVHEMMQAMGLADVGYVTGLEIRIEHGHIAVDVAVHIPQEKAAQVAAVVKKYALHPQKIADVGHGESAQTRDIVSGLERCWANVGASVRTL